MKKIVWVLEDEPDARFVYQDCLEELCELHFFESLKDLDGALAGELRPKLLIADLKLSDGFFNDYLEEKLSLGPRDFTILVVSSFENESMMEFCFEKGISDFFVKPFNKTELIFKIKIHLKDGIDCKIKDYEMEKINRSLTRTEKRIFDTFIENNGVATREQIQDNVWSGIIVHPKTIDVHMTNLRKKLLDHRISIHFQKQSTWALSR